MIFFYEIRLTFYILKNDCSKIKPIHGKDVIYYVKYYLEEAEAVKEQAAVESQEPKA